MFIFTGMKVGQQLAIQYFRSRIKFLAVLSPRKAAKYALQLFSTPLRTRRPPPEPVFAGASLHLDFEGYHITGYQWNPGAKHTVLILHGFHSTVTNFGHFVQPLIEKNYRVLAFDAPAHGMSTGTYLNALDYKKFIQFIIQKFGPINSFIAHSFGGFCTALALSEQSCPPATRLVLIAPMTETNTAIQQFFQMLDINSQKVRKLFVEELQLLGGHGPEWFSLNRLATRLPETLWIHDEDDEITPFSDVQPIIAQNHAQIRFVITKGMGHRRIYRDAKIGKTIVEFV
jgi:pimeloyl-ACP methyl ester carboxylesterase